MGNVGNVALTLREIADKVNKEAKEREIALHREFVETKIIPYLQELANRGEYSTDFIVQGYNYDVVCELLRKFGFTTEIVKYSGNNGRHITIRW